MNTTVYSLLLTLAPATRTNPSDSPCALLVRLYV